MGKTFNNLVEGVVALVLIPLALVYKLITMLLFIALIASPLILIGWIVWLIAT